MKTRLSSIVLYVFLIVSVVGYGFLSGGMLRAEAATRKDTLIAGIRSDPINLDPHNNANWPCFIVEEVIFDRLVQKNEQGNIVPMLATKWEVIDDLTVRFYLRDDVFWHNGDKFTAEDVRYSIARSVHMRGSRTMMGAFDGEGTTVINDHTIDIKVKYPFGPIYNYLASTRGNIVNAKHLEEVGVEIHGRNPMGTGPFKFVSWQSGDKISLVKNEKYWGELPNFEHMIFRVVTEGSSRALEVESGAIDVGFHIDEADIDRLEANPNINLVMGPSYTMHHANFNIYKNSWMQDVRVRKALFMAIDKPSLVKAVYGNTAVPSTSAFSYQLPYYIPTDKTVYNPVSAKALLDEAGFDYNTKIEMIVMDNSTLIAVAEVMQNMWEQIGLKASVTIMEEAAQSAHIRGRNFMINFGTDSTTSGDPDHGLFDWKTDYHGICVNENFVGISPEGQKVWDMIMSARASYDDKIRAERYAEMQNYMCNEYYGMLMIADVNAAYAINPTIEGFYCSPAYMPNLSRVNFKK